MSDTLLRRLLGQVQGRSEGLQAAASARIDRVGQGQDADRIKLQHLVIGPERRRPTVTVEIGLGQDQRHALLLGPLDGQLLAALGAGGRQRHVRPLGLGPVQRVEDPPCIIRRVGLWGRPERHDRRARERRAMLAGLARPDRVARFDLRRRGAGRLHRALPGAPDVTRRGRVAGGGRVADDLQGEGGHVRGAGLQGRFLDFDVEDLRAIEVPDQPVQGVAGLVGVALDALGGGVEGADQGLPDQGLEVLQCGVADKVEHFVHQAVAELKQGVFGRMGASVFEKESLGFVVRQPL